MEHDDEVGGRGRVRLPGAERSPLETLARRVALAVGLIVFVAVLAYLGRDGYVDAKGDEVSLLDSFYYATVSVTTTGYGDVRPESDTARLVTTLLVTPARILFLVLLVGTTLEILAERGREALALARWRRRLSGHFVVCGYGSKGRSVVRTLLNKGHAASEFVVVDRAPGALDTAAADGLASVNGDATSMAVLRTAGVGEARAVVVAPARDDSAVLITLSARELNRKATIVASAREEENVHLLRESGATSVVTSSSATGRLLGLATVHPRVVEVLEDLMTVGEGLDIAERPVEEHEIGELERLQLREPVVAVIREGVMLRFDSPEAARLHAGDRLVYLCSHPEA